MSVPLLTLSTERLRLRPPRADDVDHFYALNGDARVMRYINGGQPLSRADCERDVENRIQLNALTAPLGLWVVELRTTDEFLGWACLRPLEGGPEIEVGYRLLASAWGRGIATEAAGRLLRYGLEELQLPQVVGVAMPDNHASRRVLEKIGLRYTGTATYYHIHCVRYAIDRQEYATESVR